MWKSIKEIIECENQEIEGAEDIVKKLEKHDIVKAFRRRASGTTTLCLDIAIYYIKKGINVTYVIDEKDIRGIATQKIIPLFKSNGLNTKINERINYRRIGFENGMFLYIANSQESRRTTRTPIVIADINEINEEIESEIHAINKIYEKHYHKTLILVTI